MTEQSFNWLINLLGSTTILFAAILVRFVIDRIIPIEPMRYFRLYFDLLARKVNKPQHTPKQLIISGLLAMLITITPIWLVIVVFESLVEVTWLWQLFILWLALGWFTSRQDFSRVATALKHNQNQRAKEKLTPRLLRETDKLSALGISKAAIESAVIRFNAELATVSFIYLIFGPVAALCYRLLYEMHLSWNPSLSKFVHFGRVVTFISYACQWPSARLIGLVSLLSSKAGSFILRWRLSAPHFFSTPSAYLLETIAMNLGVTLGGAAFYAKQKVRRPVANNQGRQPAYEDINHALKHLDSMLLFFGVILIAMTSIKIILSIEM